MSRIWQGGVVCALLVTVGFGFLKQIKVARRSVHSMRGPHEDAGLRYGVLKQKASELIGAGLIHPGAFFSYHSDRKDEPGQRPAAEHFYDFQYAIAPYLVHREGRGASLYFLDFSSGETLLEFCRAKNLRILFQEEGLAIAVSKGSKSLGRHP